MDRPCPPLGPARTMGPTDGPWEGLFPGSWVRQEVATGSGQGWADLAESEDSG